jgi:SAM-dependent methyltransferase
MLTRPPLKITPEIEEAARDAALPFKARPDLHPEDELLRYIIATRGPEIGSKEYFKGGYISAHQAKRAMDSLPMASGKPRVLEFAAGFGRVSRHLRSAFPNAELVASDIHPTGCDFILQKFGIETAVSAHQPEDLSVGRGYDFIFVLSLFSHLPDKSFGRWLKALYDRLAPGGFLLFTANGQVTIRRRPEFWGRWFDPTAGYGFVEQSDQLDLDPSEYGSMAVSLTYIGNQIASYVPDALLFRFAAGAWFGQQDEWIIQKPIN